MEIRVDVTSNRAMLGFSVFLRRGHVSSGPHGPANCLPFLNVEKAILVDPAEWVEVIVLSLPSEHVEH